MLIHDNVKHVIVSTGLLLTARNEGGFLLAVPMITSLAFYS